MIPLNQNYTTTTQPELNRKKKGSKALPFFLPTQSANSFISRFHTSPRQNINLQKPSQPEDLKDSNSDITQRRNKSNFSANISAIEQIDNSVIAVSRNENSLYSNFISPQNEYIVHEQEVLNRPDMEDTNRINEINSLVVNQNNTPQPNPIGVRQSVLTKSRMNNLKSNLKGSKYKNTFINNLLRSAYIPSDLNFKSVQIKFLRALYETNQFGISLKQATQGTLYKIPVFPADGCFAQIWNLIRFIMILSAFFTLPYKAAFGFPSHISNIDTPAIDLVLVIFSILTILIQMNMSVIIDGELINSHEQVFNLYLKGDIFYDLTASISLMLNSFVFSDEYLIWPFLIFMIIYFISCLKFQTQLQFVQRYFHHFEQINLWLGIIEIIMEVIFLSHIMACLWYGVANYSLGRQTWVEYLQIQNQTNWIKYNYAFQHILIMVTAMGNSQLNIDTTELVLQNILIVVSYFIFAVSINKIGIILRQASKQDEEQKLQLRQMRRYLRSNKIPQQLQNQVSSYFQFMCDQEQKLYNEQPIQLIKRLSSTLKQQIQYQLRSNSLDHMNSLKIFSKELLQKVQDVVEEVQFAPEDTIINEGEQDDGSVYFIQKGEIQMKIFVSERDKSGLSVATLREGQTFGEYSFFTGLQRTATLVSYGYSKLIKISREVMLKAIESNINDREKYAHIRDRLLINKDLTVLNIKCQSCGSRNHFVVNCPILHFKTDRERIILKLIYPHQQQRKKFIRQGIQNDLQKQIPTPSSYSDRQFIQQQPLRARKLKSLKLSKIVEASIQRYQQTLLEEELQDRNLNQQTSSEEFSEGLPYDDLLNMQTSMTRLTAQRSFINQNSILGNLPNPMEGLSYIDHEHQDIHELSSSNQSGIGVEDFQNVFRQTQQKLTYNTAGFGNHSQIKESQHNNTMGVIQEKNSDSDSSGNEDDYQQNQKITPKQNVNKMEIQVPIRKKEPKLTFNQSQSIEFLQQSLNFPSTPLDENRLPLIPQSQQRKYSLIKSLKTSQPTKQSSGVRQNSSRSLTCGPQQIPSQNSQQTLNQNNNINSSQNSKKAKNSFHSMLSNNIPQNSQQIEDRSPGRQHSGMSATKNSQFSPFEGIENPVGINSEWCIFDFERLQNYRFYFPEYNAQIVIKRMNKFLIAKNDKFQLSNYTLNNNLMKRAARIRQILKQ